MSSVIHTAALAPDLRICLYQTMLRVRVLDERIAELYPEQEMRCPVHLSTGQEAAAVGACAALATRDQVVSAHRSHGHYLAKGGDLKAMVAEIYGRATGCAGGKGGSMHLIDLNAGFLGCAPIVGSTIAIGVGAAFSARMRSEDRIVMIFFGDGAVETGVFHESLNFAALKKLSVVFVCENNLYSVYSPMSVRQPADRPITGLARAHGIDAYEMDGNDVEAVYRLAQQAVEKARAGRGPTFLELATYRWREHCGPNFDNDIGYRTESEFQAWRERDPVEAYRRLLLAEHIIGEDEATALENMVAEEVELAIAFAKQSPYPAAANATTHLYAE